MPPKTDNTLGIILLAAGAGVLLLSRGKDGNGVEPPPPNGVEPPPPITPKVTGLSIGYEVEVVPVRVTGLSIGYEVEVVQPPPSMVTGLSVGYEIDFEQPTFIPVVTGLSIGYEVHISV